MKYLKTYENWKNDIKNKIIGFLNKNRLTEIEIEWRGKLIITDNMSFYKIDSDGTRNPRRFYDFTFEELTEVLRILRNLSQEEIEYQRDIGPEANKFNM